VSPLVISALLMGLFGGTHCVAMCGGVVGVLCSATSRDVPRKGLYVVAYNAGRLGSYSVLGLAFATLGTLSTGVFPLDGVQFTLRALSAVFMLAIGLHLLGLPMLVKHLEAVGTPLWRKLSPLTQRLLPIRSPLHAACVGALWGFMPCGLLYGALALAASADSPAMGAATMAAFGLGTLPVLVTMGALAQTVAAWTRKAWVRRAAGVAVLGFGVWTSAGLAGQADLGLGLGGGAHRCCPTK
jgi:uncharacterized protein